MFLLADVPNRILNESNFIIRLKKQQQTGAKPKTLRCISTLDEREHAPNKQTEEKKQGKKQH